MFYYFFFNCVCSPVPFKVYFSYFSMSVFATNKVDSSLSLVFLWTIQTTSLSCSIFHDSLIDSSLGISSFSCLSDHLDTWDNIITNILHSFVLVFLEPLLFYLYKNFCFLILVYYQNLQTIVSNLSQEHQFPCVFDKSFNILIPSSPIKKI